MLFSSCKPKRRPPDRGRKFRSPIEALESRRLLAADVAQMGTAVLESHPGASEAPADHSAGTCGESGYDVRGTADYGTPITGGVEILETAGMHLKGNSKLPGLMETPDATGIVASVENDHITIGDANSRSRFDPAAGVGNDEELTIDVWEHAFIESVGNDASPLITVPDGSSNTVLTPNRFGDDVLDIAFNESGRSSFHQIDLQ